MVLDTGATTSVLYTLRVQQLDRGPQLLSTAQAQGTAAGPFSSSQPARRVECDLAVRGVVGPVRWILAPGGSNEPPGVVGLLGSDWLHAAGSAAAVTFDWRHGLCRIAMDGGSSTWDIPLVTPRAAEGDGVRCVVEIPTTAAAADGAADTPPWTLPPTWRRVTHVRSARDKAARTLPTLADNPDRPASYTADELVRIVTERAAAAHEPEDMLAFQAARERVLRAGYHGAFGESIQGRPPMKCKPVSIDVGGHKPIYTAPYHLHKGNDDIIEAAVDDMLRMGVVREGTSGWSSPIVLIKKPHTNLLRLCLDYRAVNAVTRSGPGGQLPSVRQCLRRMHGSSVFTTFDLSQAFWLMPLDAAAQAVTAFATATRTLLWTRCPFGVVHGPRWLNVSLRAVLAKFPFCTVYADDVTVHSSNIVEHEEHVLAVLAALADARCVLSASKMQLIQRSVKVLGHVVSAEGVAIADDDKAALLQFPRPTTVEGVRVS